MTDKENNEATDTLERDNLAKTLSHTHLDTILYEMTTIDELKNLCNSNSRFMAVLKYQLETSSGVAFVAKLDSKPVGFIYGEISCVTEYLIVDEDYQRKGIAKMLLKELEGFALRKNLKSITLDVNKTKEYVIDLYTNVGFQIDDDDDDDEMIGMSKKL